MKLLFVCRSNVGRSQVATEFYNALYPGTAESAGTKVDIPGQKLQDRPKSAEIVEVMNELGIDMSENIRTQLTPAMLDDYHKVIVLAEPEAIPDYLRDSSNAEFWNVEDPSGKNVAEARVIRDKIKLRVEALAKRLRASS